MGRFLGSKPARIDGPHPTIFPSHGDPTAQGAQSWRLVGINVGKMRCSRKGRNDIETNCLPVGEPWSGKKSFRGLSEVNLTVAGRGEDTHLSSPAMSHFLLYFMLWMIHSTDYKGHSSVCVCVCALVKKITKKIKNTNNNIEVCTELRPRIRGRHGSLRCIPLFNGCQWFSVLIIRSDKCFVCVL